MLDRREEMKSGVSGSNSQQKLQAVTGRVIQASERRKEAAKRRVLETEKRQSDQGKPRHHWDMPSRGPAMVERGVIQSNS